MFRIKISFVKLTASLLVIVFLLVPLNGCKKEKSLLDPKNAVHITVWHYYNSTQLVEFDAVVTKFNQTKGKELGIFVEAISQGNVNDLATKVIDTAKGSAGVGSLPNIFVAYPDSAYEAMKLGQTVNLNDYMTQEEIDTYNPDFWQEGLIEGVSLLFPIAKSTEVMYLDKFAWDEYVTNAGIDAKLENCVDTWENVVETSKQYYEFTDSLTPDILNDGKAFTGIDALANFIIINLKQQNIDFMVNDNGKGKVNFNKANMRRLWDIYVPSIVSGYFANTGRYRSDDMKTGLLISYIGSSTGSSYIPNTITFNDGTTRPANVIALPVPTIAGGEKYVVQQGGSMVVSKSDKAHEYASVEFLKWLTDYEQNIQFAISAAYLPVKKDAFKGEIMQKKLSELAKSDDVMEKNSAMVFDVAIEQLQNCKTYISPPFAGRLEIRYALDDLNNLAAKLRKDALIAMELGMDYEQAVEKFSGDELFEKWYTSLEEQVKLILENS